LCCRRQISLGVHGVKDFTRPGDTKGKPALDSKKHHNKKNKKEKTRRLNPGAYH